MTTSLHLTAFGQSKYLASSCPWYAVAQHQSDCHPRVSADNNSAPVSLLDFELIVYTMPSITPTFEVVVAKSLEKSNGQLILDLGA